MTSSGGKIGRQQVYIMREENTKKFCSLKLENRILDGADNEQIENLDQTGYKYIVFFRN